MNMTIFNAFCLLFWSRHKHGIVIFMAVVLLYTVMPYLTFLGLVHKIFTIFIPFFTIFFTLAVFSFGDSNTRLSGESNFPSHFFTLPVSTATLIAYPMIVGSCFMVLNCFLVDQLWLRPWDIRIDYWWAAVIAISFLIWFQAIVWGQYRLTGTSIILVSLLIVVFVLISIFIFYYKNKAFASLSFLSLQLFLACYIASRAVSRARKGFVLAPWKWTRRFSFSFARINKTHDTPYRAQCYLENRLHGLMLPAMTLLMGSLFFVSSLLILFFGEDPQRVSKIPLTSAINLGSTFYMIYMSSMSWFAFYSADWYNYNKTRSISEHSVIPNFISTLPITNQELIRAKFMAFSKNATIGFLISLGFSCAMIGLYLIASDPDLIMSPFLSRFGLLKTITMLIVIPILALVFIILNSLSSMWLWLFRKKVLWFVLPPVIVLFLVKEIWADATWIELLFAYHPWIIGIGCAVKLMLMCFFLPWLIKNKYYRFNSLAKSVAVWIFFMGLCSAFIIWISPVRLSYALIWGGLVCMTPILGLLGTPVALKYSRTQ